ncbi:MAG: 2,3-diketo-5-methylthio-1-phosphopentane phosphatase [Dehalococcoidia bacterium]|nr:MAG: 2,3-diketo-5-methylthio-1-phosphopentane phosphatase [Dehalococcoidia bacterium]
MQTLVQCDFDGTVTEEDTSFFLLDAFAQGDWRRLLRKYKEHKISVGEFNTKAFTMVKDDKPTLLEALKGKVKVRAGFHELRNYCLKKDFRLVIVSNGLDFYIKAVLKDLGLDSIEVHAAQASFHPEGMKVQYVGPDGKRLEDNFKVAYIKSFLKLGYRIVYVGNGDSDFPPAKYAHHVFATGELLAYCRENNLNYEPFENFIDIVRYIDLL